MSIKDKRDVSPFDDRSISDPDDFFGGGGTLLLFRVFSLALVVAAVAYVLLNGPPKGLGECRLSDDGKSGCVVVYFATPRMPKLNITKENSIADKNIKVASDGDGFITMPEDGSPKKKDYGSALNFTEEKIRRRNTLSRQSAAHRAAPLAKNLRC